MKSSLKKVKDCRVKLTVEVEASLVETRYQEVLKDFQKAAQMPGFREGKAPMDLVEKKFSKEAEEEVLKSLIPEAYHRSLATHKVSAVSLPSISDIKLQRGKNLTFAAEFDQSPEFSLKNYKGVKIKKVPVDVPHEEVEKGLSSLLDSRAELIPLVESRAIQRGDFIVSDIEIWKEGKYTPSKKGALLFAEPNADDDFYEKVVGANLEEVREISVDPTEEEKKQGIVGRKPLYKVWIRGIKEKKVPALDDTFAQNFGKQTVNELREAVRKDIAGYKHSESYEKMKGELFEKLLALASFTIPEALVQKQKERLMEQTQKQYQRMGMPPGQFEEFRLKAEADAEPKARDQVKLYFILQKIADQEKIEADEAAVERKMQSLAEESKRPLEEVRRVFEDDARESMRETKTIDFLLANAKLEDQKTEGASK